MLSTAEIKEKKNQEKCLNGGQKNVIEGTLNFYLQDIHDLTRPRLLKPRAALAALEAMVNDQKLDKEEINNFAEQDVLTSIRFVREIFDHPCPQNRAASYNGYEGDFSMFRIVAEDSFLLDEAQTLQNLDEKNKSVVYKNGRIITSEYVLSVEHRQTKWKIVAKEPIGKLSLTNLEDSKTPPVTKKAVIDYIRLLVAEAKHVQNTRWIEFIKSILKVEDIVAKLTPSEIFDLAKECAEGAFLFVQTRELVKRLEPGKFSELAYLTSDIHRCVREMDTIKYHHKRKTPPTLESHASKRSSSSQIVASLKKEEEWSLDTTLLVLRIPYLYTKLDFKKLLSQCIHYAEAGKIILETPVLAGQCTESDLHKLGLLDIENIKLIIENPMLAMKCKKQTLVEFACQKPQMALQIVQDLRFQEKFNCVDLKRLGQINVDVALYILKNTALCERCLWSDIVDLAKKNLAVAKYVLGNLSDQLGSRDLLNIGMSDAECAKIILATPMFRLECGSDVIDQLSRAHLEEEEPRPRSPSLAFS